MLDDFLVALLDALMRLTLAAVVAISFVAWMVALTLIWLRWVWATAREEWEAKR